MVYYKKDSVILRDFIDKNSVKVSMPRIVLSPQPRQFISKVHGLIGDAFKKSSTPFFKLVSAGSFGKDFEKSENYSYICSEVRKTFDPVNKYKKTIEIRIGKRLFRVYFVLPVPMNPSDARVYSDACDIYARRIYVWLYVANEFACNECSKELDIFLYLSDEKKMLPDVCGDAIERIHVNTAFTTSCAEKTEINIFRNEEWFKVLIHESFHCLGMDFSNYEEVNALISKEIKKKIPIDAKILAYETYSEIWAEILNVIITVSIETHGKHMSVVSLVEGMLEKELFFSMFQCAKLLDHFKLDYKDLYSEDQTSIFSFSGGKRKRYQEKTAAFSYFFMKTILLFNCNMFLEWTIARNGQSILFKDPEKNARVFIDDLILAKYNDPMFVGCMDKMRATFYKRSGNNFIYKTLRMTANEIV